MFSRTDMPPLPKAVLVYSISRRRHPLPASGAPPPSALLAGHEQRRPDDDGAYAEPDRQVHVLPLLHLELQRPDLRLVRLLGVAESPIRQGEHAADDQEHGQDLPRLHRTLLSPRDAAARVSRSARSSGPSRRHRPRARSPSSRSPILTRTSSRTSWPTAAHMRRTWRFLPSVRTISSQVPSRPEPSARSRAGRVRVPSPSATPDRSASRAAASGTPSTRTWYVFGTWCSGSVSLWPSRWSLVTISSPALSRSSRPTGNTHRPTSPSRS